MIFNYSGLNNLTSGNVGFIQHWFIKSGILPGTASLESRKVWCLGIANRTSRITGPENSTKSQK